jgi:hypothetical protein
MWDLIILKEFYDSQIPQHDQMYDKIELPKALESKRLKSRFHYVHEGCFLSSLLKDIHFFDFSSHILIMRLSSLISFSIQTKGYGQICTYARTFNKMDHLKTRPAQYVIFWATGLMLMDILWEKGKT